MSTSPVSEEKPTLEGQAFLSSQILHRITLQFEHCLIFTQNVFAPSNPTLVNVFKKDSDLIPRVWVALDQGLAEANPTLVSEIQRYFTEHSRAVCLIEDPLLIPGGEVSKTSPEIHSQLVSAMHHAKLCRHSYVLVAGGGAVLDAVCYAASIVHRGIRQIRLPSTVLAQTDAGIGIKNGIDLFGKKNFLGTFHPPEAVINDSLFLVTLDSNHWRSGTAEAIKVALIRDAAFFTWIEQSTSALAEREMDSMKKLIRRGAELHLSHIATSGDPFEKGSARPLDFGHWSAHKLEQLTDFKIGHGNAVAIGIALDCLYAEETGLLSPKTVERVLTCLTRLGFNLWNEKLLAHHFSTGKLEILLGLEEFREHLGGRLSIPLIREIGVVADAHHVDEPALLTALARLRRYSEKPRTAVFTDQQQVLYPFAYSNADL